MHQLFQYWSFSIVTFLLLLAWKPSAAVSALCLSNQSMALLRFKQGLSLPGPESLISWHRGSNCCSWEGVTCDSFTGFVISLQLSGTTYRSHNSSCIDPSLFHLSRLRLLDLSYNRFNGPIPSSLAELRELTHLNLSHNDFSSQIPAELSMMRQLVSLDLSDYGYRVELGRFNLSTLLGDLNRLRILRLDDIDISMSGADCISVISSTMPNLQELSLSSCSISGPLNESILQLKSLSYLDLGYNNLSSIPKFIGNLTSLRFLRLSSCHLRGTFPPAIFMLPQLQILDISENNLQGSFFAKLPLGSKFQVLDLHRSGLGGSIPNSFGNLSELRIIRMNDCNFIGSIPLLLSNLTQLQIIDLSSNNLSGQIPPLSARTITEIRLSNNSFSGVIPESFCKLDQLTRLNLQHNLLSGCIPSALLNVPSLEMVDLSHNNLTGSLSQFTNASYLLLDIDLSHNSLRGEIPTTITSLSRLESIDLSINHFVGTFNISLFMGMKNLWMLDLSENNLTVVDGPRRHDQNEAIHLSNLYLRSCNIHSFPEFIRNQRHLFILDLSNNKISGSVPSWLSGMSYHLSSLNLSHNMLTTLEMPTDVDSMISSSITMDLHSNLLQGDLAPLLSHEIDFLDISFNRFTSFNLSSNFSSLMEYLSTSNNNISGTISENLCSSWLELLDLSNNSLVGSIPYCLTNLLHLDVLDLSKNQLGGPIPNGFGSARDCNLVILNLNSNQISGGVPTSLSKCHALEVLDLSKNKLTGEFPSWLGTLRQLRVLSLRSNHFHGSIVPPPYDKPFPMLQILDVSSNGLNGTLEPGFFQILSMMKGEPNGHEAMHMGVMTGYDHYYEDRVTITIKGTVAQMDRLLSLMTSIDLSDNHFIGEIPREIGTLHGLVVLNMSNNDLIGQMPQSLENLVQLESLDLS